MKKKLLEPVIICAVALLAALFAAVGVVGVDDPAVVVGHDDQFSGVFQDQLVAVFPFAQVGFQLFRAAVAAEEGEEEE